MVAACRPPIPPKRERLRANKLPSPNHCESRDFLLVNKNPSLSLSPSLGLSVCFLSFFLLDAQGLGWATASTTLLSLKSLCGGGVPSSHPSLGFSVFFLF